MAIGVAASLLEAQAYAVPEFNSNTSTIRPFDTLMVVSHSNHKLMA